MRAQDQHNRPQLLKPSRPSSKEREKGERKQTKPEKKSNQGKTEKGKQGPNLETLKNFKSGSGKDSMQENECLGTLTSSLLILNPLSMLISP